MDVHWIFYTMAHASLPYYPLEFPRDEAAHEITT